MWNIFSPADVGQMSLEMITKIAGESTESQTLRQQLERKLQILERGFDICQRHSTHEPVGKSIITGTWIFRSVPKIQLTGKVGQTTSLQTFSYDSQEYSSDDNTSDVDEEEPPSDEVGPALSLRRVYKPLK